MSAKLDILTFGILLVIAAICLIAWMPLEFIELWMVAPLILALLGVWIMILGGIRTKHPEKYARGPFSTFALGALTTAIGGALLFSSINWIYSLVLLLISVAALSIAAAFRK